MADANSSSRTSKRSHAGFFSSVSTFSLPAGQHVKPGEVRGYYVDMRIKSETPQWPPPDLPGPDRRLHVMSLQWGLGCFERYLAGEGDIWLAAAEYCADDVVALQEPSGRLAGGLPHGTPLRHTFALRPPWLSAMAQGQAASLLVRLYLETGSERYADAAKQALGVLDVDSVDGGVRARLNGTAFPEEYPTSPPSFVLNGGMFAMWGIHDVGVGLREPDTLAAFGEAADVLAANIHRWDAGYWSRYDLFPHPVPNLASSFYHDLHVTQLRAMNGLAPRPQLQTTADRWQGYAASSANRGRVFAHKGLFRVLVPRNEMLARRLPWSPLRAV
jgi:heparosan-N-sulfate-glucuronate 5-epimerase